MPGEKSASAYSIPERLPHFQIGSRRPTINSHALFLSICDKKLRVINMEMGETFLYFNILPSFLIYAVSD